MDNETDFEPHLGRLRALGGGRTRRYLQRVIAAANLAGGGRPIGRGKAVFHGSRIGRGAAVGRMLSSRDAYSAFRARRVIVKSSIVRLSGKGAAAAAAHLRYLQRDGTSPAGERGQLYDAEKIGVDGKAFLERGSDDRHQFRFIVSAEDGAEYEDLKPLTRRLMTRVEEDLGTKLEWVATDHFNTGHPHTHILVRGVDERGRDLVIAREYLTTGLRERAAELVAIDLGPRSDLDIATRLQADVEQERLTSLDRQLLRQADANREVAAGDLEPVLRQPMIGRLHKLVRMGLAEPAGTLRWRLDAELAPTLRQMGERDDILRTMQRAFTERALARAPSDYAIFAPEGADERASIIGRVVARGLADEHRNRHYLIVDALDGRSHYVAVGRANLGEVPAGDAVVRIVAKQAQVREVDRTIVAVAAANQGHYDVDAHFRFDPGASEAFVTAHLRRLEALCRAHVPVTRDASGSWEIEGNHLSRVAAHEQRVLLDHPVDIEVLASRPLASLAIADGATWLDRTLVAPPGEPNHDAGFGADFRQAQTLRRQWLMQQGLACEIESIFRPNENLLSTLSSRDIARAATALQAELGLSFEPMVAGERLEGVYRRSVELVSGRYALIERAHDFTLVPWRPVLERAANQTVSGIVREGAISWTIGRGRSGPTIS